MSRRFYYKDGKVVERGVAESSARAGTPDHVSDSLGFGKRQLAEMEADRKANGFGGIEFVPDPQVEGFCQVKYASSSDYDRYARHRGFVNATGVGGVIVSVEELNRAKEIVSRTK